LEEDGKPGQRVGEIEKCHKRHGEGVGGDDAVEQDGEIQMTEEKSEAHSLP
jgi:hypothetical protein